MVWAEKADSADIDGYVHSFIENLKTAEEHIIDRYPGSGTTMSALMCCRGKWISLHIGDSRCYAVYDDRIFRTKDHSPVEELFRSGMIDEDEMNTHPMSNVINTYVGGGHYNRAERDDIPDGLSSLTLCSDGAFGYMPMDEFNGLISADNEASSIVDIALQEGSRDNISALRIIPVTGQE